MSDITNPPTRLTARRNHILALWECGICRKGSVSAALCSCHARGSEGRAQVGWAAGGTEGAGGRRSVGGLIARLKKRSGPRCLMQREALYLLRLRASRERRFAKDVWISAAHLATPPARPMRLRSRYKFEFSAVQISGLPGNDRPSTHTVTLHPGKVLVIARWRHLISLRRVIRQTRV